MTETDTDVDVEPTASVAQNDADELSEEIGINIQLIDEGLNHEDDKAALEALLSEIDVEDPPQSIHMSTRDEGVSNYFWVADDIAYPGRGSLQTELMAHLANHLDEVARFLRISPAAAAMVAAEVAESWDGMDEK